MVDVVEINAIEHLESIRLRWTSLFYETRSASFFQTLDWLKIYEQQSPDDERLRVFVVHRGGEILGIVPLIQRVEVVDGRAVETVRYPKNNLAKMVGPLGGNPTLTLKTVVQHLADRTWEWQRLVLASIGEHDHGRTLNAMKLAGLSTEAKAESTNYYLDLGRYRDDSFEINNEQLPSTMDFQRFRPQDFDFSEQELAERALARVLELSARDDLRELANAAMNQGMLDLCLVKSEDHVAAFSFNTIVDGSVEQIDVFDAGCDSLVKLTKCMLRDSCERNDRSVLFCREASAVAKAVGATPTTSHVWEHSAATTFRDRLRGVLSFGKY